MFKNKYKFFLPLFSIFVVALLLRIYKLDSVPYGFHIDEAKVGWNAYSILKTGRDDKGNLFSVYYDSFGDFRPAGLIYLVVPSVAIFGNTILAVRLPFAIVGALTILAIFFLVLEIFGKQKKDLAKIAAIMLAFNPWHIIASRATSESIIVIFLTIWGLYFFIKLYRSDSWRDMLLSLFSLLLAFFFYHNIRVLAPVFVLFLIFLYRIIFLRKIKFKQLLVTVSLILVTLLIFSSPEARGRASQVSLKSDFKVLYEVTKMPNEEGPNHVFIARAFHNRLSSYIRRFVEEYREYFGTNFLTGDSVKPIRYMVPQTGLLTYIELILVLIGVFFTSRKKELLIVLGLLFVAPLPAAVTLEDTPNIQRAILMIPFLVIIAAYGYYELLKLPRKWKFLSIFVIIGYFLNFVYFSHMYLVHQKMSLASYYRDGGNVELVKKIVEIKGIYKKVILTNNPDDLYPWIAFLTKTDPILFNQSYRDVRGGIRTFENIVFSVDKCPLNEAIKRGDKNLDSVLFVDNEGCEIDKKTKSLADIKLIDTIKRPDGSNPYYLRTVTVY